MRSAAVQPAVLGVDVGLDGALAVLQQNGDVHLHPTPILKAGTSRREYDVAGMLAILTAQPVALAVIESVGARPGQGVTSMFRFGYGAGLWVGLLSGLGIPFQLVTPQAWKKEILRGTTRDKTAAILFVQRRFPAANLLTSARARMPHDGMAEAACLAEWGRRLLSSGGTEYPAGLSEAPPLVAENASAPIPGPDHNGASFPEAQP